MDCYKDRHLYGSIHIIFISLSPSVSELAASAGYPKHYSSSPPPHPQLYLAGSNESSRGGGGG